jgi:hypothetical protein
MLRCRKLATKQVCSPTVGSPTSRFLFRCPNSRQAAWFGQRGRLQKYRAAGAKTSYIMFILGEMSMIYRYDDLVNTLNLL